MPKYIQSHDIKIVRAYGPVSDFAGDAPQFDDITCLALKVK